METEAKRQRALIEAPPTEAAPAEGVLPSVKAVFDNVDLLKKILLLLDAPPYLIRAALVSKDWLAAAADPDFLRRFRAQCPPRLLGFLASFGRGASASSRPDVAVVRFVPLPHPPELAAAARLVGAAFNGGKPTGIVVDCRNGRVLIQIGGYCGWRYSVRSPLCTPAVTTVTRPPPRPPHRVQKNIHEGVCCAQLELLPYPGAGDLRDALSGFGRMLDFAESYERVIHQAVYVRRQTRGWAAHVSPPLQLPVRAVVSKEAYSLMVGGRWLCMTAVLGCIVVLDLSTASFFVVGYPDGVPCCNEMRSHSFARAGDSEIYLVSAKGVELHVWFRRMDAGDQGIWERMETFYLPLLFGDRFTMEFWNYVEALNDDPANVVDHRIRAFHSVEVQAVGDDAEFVFLTVGKNDGGVFLLDVKKRTVEMVLQTSLENDGPLCGISAFLMPWPPVFPALNVQGG